ncbi:uncharacterized protein [Euwallacea fornicatus]|uniref:uncharacterized protein n=1 Tax=Euwallacea fornicatus TaxID=995702 RepID=UPI0033904211
MASNEVKRIFLIILLVMVVEKVVPRAVYDEVNTFNTFDALFLKSMRSQSEIGKSYVIQHEEDLETENMAFQPVDNASLLRPVYGNYLFHVKCKSSFKRIGGRCIRYL